MENLKQENSELITYVRLISSVVGPFILLFSLASLLYSGLVNKPLNPILAIATSIAFVLLIALYVYQFYLVSTIKRIVKKMEDYDLDKPICGFITRK
jgi:O-antigen ligase